MLLRTDRHFLLRWADTQEMVEALLSLLGVAGPPTLVVAGYRLLSKLPGT
jgi:hypothetical protein